MTEARLHVDLADAQWKGELTCAYPRTRMQVLATVTCDRRDVELVQVSGPDVAAVTDDVETHDEVLEVTVVQRTDGQATLQVETGSPAIMRAAGEAGMPVEFPFVVEDGVATVDVTGSRDRLSTLGSELRRLGLDYEVDYVQETLEANQPLTETQRELLLAAVEHGYYETPRQCSLTELAEAVGLAKSTCSETLHRAEQVVVESFLAECPTRQPRERKAVTP